MSLMKLNSKGKLARFYLWFAQDGEGLPQDLCTYFWGLVGRAIAVLLSGWILFLLLYGLYLAGSFVVWLVRVFPFRVLTTVAAILIFALVVWFSNRKKRGESEFLRETRAIIRGKVDAVKNRYCPRIEWR